MSVSKIYYNIQSPFSTHIHVINCTVCVSVHCRHIHQRHICQQWLYKCLAKILWNSWAVWVSIV